MNTKEIFIYIFFLSILQVDNEVISGSFGLHEMDNHYGNMYILKMLGLLCVCAA